MGNYKKKLFSLVLVTCILLSFFPTITVEAADPPGAWDGTVATAFSGGNGTSDNPYQISSAAELAYLAKMVKDGTTYKGQFFILKSDIVLNAGTFDKDGIYSDGTPNSWIRIGDSGHKFEGSFDGGNHTIQGMYIKIDTSTDNWFQGLFGWVNGGTVKNVGVVNSYISGGMHLGCVVGKAEGGTLVQNCTSSGYIVGDGMVGGVVGSIISAVEGNDTQVQNCINNATVGIRGADFNAGGVVGHVEDGGMVDQCRNNGSISGASSVGGVAGTIDGGDENSTRKGIVQNCANFGSVTGSGDNVGGIVGFVSGTVQNCSNNMPVIGSGDYVGGIVGYVLSGTMENCSNLSSVNGSGKYVGGIVGMTPGMLQACTNRGNVQGALDYVGGVAGYIWGNTAQDCNNIGNVIGKKDYIGGVAGLSGTLENCCNGGSVKGTGKYIGGVSGYHWNGTIQKCYNSGNIEGSALVGGVVGNSSATVKFCCNSGGVSGTSYIGGVVGYDWNGTLQNCYTIGSVSGTSHVGGIVGFRSSPSSTLENNYYDKQMCSFASGIGNEPGNTGKLISEMTGQALKGSLGDDAQWAFSDHLYPRPKGIESNDVTLLSASSICLANGETVSDVKTNFTVSTENEITWTSNSPSISISGGNATVTKQNSDTKVTLTASKGSVSRSVTLTVPANQEMIPQASVDYSNGTLKGLNKGEKYLIEGVEYPADITGIIPIFDSWLGKQIKIIKKGNETAKDSAAQALQIPQKAVTPSAPQLLSKTHNTITVSIISGQEYSIEGGKTWSNDGTFSGLNANTSYQICTRIKGTPTAIVSNISSPLIVTTSQAPSGGGDSHGGSGNGGSAASPRSQVTTKTENITSTATIHNALKLDAKGDALVEVTEQLISEAIAKAENEASTQGGKVKRLEVRAEGSATGVNSITTSIPKLALDAITNGKAEGLLVTNPIATVSFDAAAISEINARTDASIKVTAKKVDETSLSEAQKAEVAGRPVYDLTVSSGSKVISSFGAGKATVSIPYTLKPGEDANKIIIYYLSDKGELVTVSHCKYNSATGSVSFTTDHFSKYAVGLATVGFTDTAGWYSGYVDYLAARGIIKGYNGSFYPQSNITRGEFVAILAHLSGADLRRNSTAAFHDVRATDWYSGAINWAYQTGVATGVGSNFEPNASITRQDMAVMLLRYVEKVEGKALKKVNPAVSFTDSLHIAEYAKASVTAMQQAGILSGKDGNAFEPQAYATRAETAKMIAVLLQGIID